MPPEQASFSQIFERSIETSDVKLSQDNRFRTVQIVKEARRAAIVAPRWSCPSTGADNIPCQIKAGFGILMPMMCASLDQSTQLLSEADVLRGAPAMKKAGGGAQEAYLAQ